MSETTMDAGARPHSDHHHHDSGRPNMDGGGHIAGILVFVALLVFGLFTRPVALILSGEMAFAYWMSHAPRAMYPVLNNGDAAVLYCFWFLYLAFAGGGAWSLDRMLFGKR